MGKYKKYKIKDLEFGDEIGRDELDLWFYTFLYFPIDTLYFLYFLII